MLKIYDSRLSFWAASLVIACHTNPNSSDFAPNTFLPQHTVSIGTQLPLFTPCPDSWNESEFNAGAGYHITFCKPSTNAPQTPAPPEFLPCPVGWTEVEDERTSLITCHPFGPEGQEECSESDEAHFLGESGCIPLGTECAETLWATNLPTASDTPIVYVQVGAPSGGDIDGSRLNPFATIREAIEYAGEDAIIALSKGTFDESVDLPQGIVVWGACVAQTVLTSSISNEEVNAVVTSRHPDTGVRNLQITGMMGGVYVSGMDAELHLENVLVIGAHLFGIYVDAGAAKVSNVVVRDTQSRLSDGRLGRGLHIKAGAKVEVSRALFSNNKEIGASAVGINTELTLHDVLVSDTQSSQNDEKFGRGLYVDAGPTVEVSRALFSNNREIGILVSETDTQVTLYDVLVKDTQGQQSDGMWGTGLYIQEGSTVEVSRALFKNNRLMGVYAIETNTRAIFHDVLVNDTQSQQSDGMWGIGLYIQEGPTVEVNHVVFSNNRTAGISITSPNTRASLRDVVVNDTRSQLSNSMYGKGFSIQKGAIVDISRAVINKNRDTGVGIAGTNTLVTIHDILVSDTQGSLVNELFGRALSVDEAQVEVSRAVFSNNTETSVAAFGNNTLLTLHDLLINDTQSSQRDKTGGHGLHAQEGAKVEVHRAVFSRNRELGVSAVNKNTRIELQDIIITDTLQNECVSNPDPVHRCSKYGAGIGIGSYYEAHIEIRRFVVHKSAHCGVQLSFGADENINRFDKGGTMSLSHGIVSNNTVCGINVQTKNIDLDDLTESVLYFQNNYNNLDTTYLPPPKTVLPSEPTDI